MFKPFDKRASRARRRRRIRGSVEGTQERPRLSVFRSLQHIYAQVIDDATGTTLVAASTNEPTLRAAEGDKTSLAKQIGQRIAERARARGIEKVVFDRGGYKYHGRVKALADGAREGGLQF